MQDLEFHKNKLSSDYESSSQIHTLAFIVGNAEYGAIDANQLPIWMEMVIDFLLVSVSHCFPICINWLSCPPPPRVKQLERNIIAWGHYYHSYNMIFKSWERVESQSIIWMTLEQIETTVMNALTSPKKNNQSMIHFQNSYFGIVDHCRQCWNMWPWC